MGFPSEKGEAFYRNPMPEVYRFFETLHQNDYYIYNLCAEKERIYDPSKFHGRVKHFPFYDHNAPRINLIAECCQDISTWLQEDEEHMVGIHCKAGKGRTGLIVCCYLLFDGTCTTSDEALVYYGNKRTKDGKGVTIASQIRYIRYYERVLKEMDGIIPDPAVLILTRIKITSYPKKEVNGDPYVIIEINDTVVHTSEVGTIEKMGKKSYKADIPVFGRVEGDIKIQLSIRKKPNGKQKLCHFWFNTGFIIDNKVDFIKEEIDVANKDKKCKIFKEDFAIEAFFKEPDPEEMIEQNQHVSQENSRDENSNDNSGEEPVRKKDNKRKSFYDYSDYGNLQEQLEITTEDDGDDDDDNVNKEQDS